MANLHHYYGCS
ncbi:hypothetical protein CP10743SC13_1974A, partial [Chlamydia psittaci 10_743_SC13]